MVEPKLCVIILSCQHVHFYLTILSGRAFFCITFFWGDVACLGSSLLMLTLDRLFWQSYPPLRALWGFSVWGTAFLFEWLSPGHICTCCEPGGGNSLGVCTSDNLGNTIASFHFQWTFKVGRLIYCRWIKATILTFFHINVPKPDLNLGPKAW